MVGGEGEGMLNGVILRREEIVSSFLSTFLAMFSAVMALYVCVYTYIHTNVSHFATEGGSIMILLTGKGCYVTLLLIFLSVILCMNK